MSKPKQSVTLPSIKKTVNVSKQKPPQTTDSSIHYVTLHRVKQLSGWFSTWYAWQRRIFICRLMELCSRDQLELLATSLEPVLHLDFSTSFAPHLQALHLDGVATFQVQRTLIQNVLNPFLSTTSWACLQSLPLTSTDGESETVSTKAKLSNNNLSNTRDDKDQLKKEQGVILPALPLTHTRHAQSNSSRGTSMEDIVALRKKRFGSVPDFRATAHLLKHVRHKEFFKPPGAKHHQRSRSLGVPSLRERKEENRQAENFKRQLTGLSQWMEGWEGTQRAYLLLEIIKICDKELLGYFVQCLYQRLHESIGVDSLPDQILLKIFSYLRPIDLCRAAQTCRRWNRVSNQDSLWKAHCHHLGMYEGVGDLSKAVETASGQTSVLASTRTQESESSFVDWKMAYKELRNVMTRIKDLVLKAAKVERENQISKEMKGASKTSGSTIKQQYSLKKMLQMLYNKAESSGSRPATTQDLLRSAPESAACTRRKVREERQEAQKESERLEMERLMSARYHHRKPKDRSALNSPDVGTSLGVDMMVDVESWRNKVVETVQLVDVALDTRPSVPTLPNPEGIECLVLAGCLTGGSTPKPGRVQPIPRLRRLSPLLSPVYCLQCDQKKIVSGTANREILVHDIRTGRNVKTLTGHKGSVQCLQYDCFKIVSGSWDTTCIVWDAVHFEPLKELRGHTDCVSCLQFDQEILVTGSHDKSIRVWSTSTWDCLTVIGNAHKRPITCLQFNQWAIASGSTDKCVKLWSPTSRHLIDTLSHDAAITSLHLSHFLLVTASLTGDILLWNLETRTPIIQWSQLSGASLMGMSLSAGKIYGAGSDGVLYEWDICTGTCIRTLTGHSRQLTCVWTGQDKVVTASEDKTVCIWYSKKAVAKELVLENGDTDLFLQDLPIRVVTERIQQTI